MFARRSGALIFLMKNLETPWKTSRVGRYAFYGCTEPQVAKLMEAGEFRGRMKFSR